MNLAFGAAASMVHPATGYSVVRSLLGAPKYASVIAKIKISQCKQNILKLNVAVKIKAKAKPWPFAEWKFYSIFFISWHRNLCRTGQGISEQAKENVLPLFNREEVKDPKRVTKSFN